VNLKDRCGLYWKKNLTPVLSVSCPGWLPAISYANLLKIGIGIAHDCNDYKRGKAAFLLTQFLPPPLPSADSQLFENLRLDTEILYLHSQFLKQKWEAQVQECHTSRLTLTYYSSDLLSSVCMCVYVCLCVEA